MAVYMETKSRKYQTMLEEHGRLWVDNDSNALFLLKNGQWVRIPLTYHPAHNVYCEDSDTTASDVSLTTENDWWYDNETGIWWYSSASGFQISSRSCIPLNMSQSQTWESPEHLIYTAVLYNTVQHYHLTYDHHELDEVPNCIKLDRIRNSGPSYAHPTSLVMQNGIWVPHRPVYFGVPSFTLPRDELRVTCMRCWWYLSNVTVGDFESAYQLSLGQQYDKNQRVAFGPYHLGTIVWLHSGYCTDDTWVAQSDLTTPPSLHSFKYKLTDVVRMDHGSTSL
jgi:hypothetical protein